MSVRLHVVGQQVVDEVRLAMSLASRIEHGHDVVRALGVGVGGYHAAVEHLQELAEARGVGRLHRVGEVADVVLSVPLGKVAEHILHGVVEGDEARGDVLAYLHGRHRLAHILRRLRHVADVPVLDVAEALAAWAEDVAVAHLQLQRQRVEPHIVHALELHLHVYAGDDVPGDALLAERSLPLLVHVVHDADELRALLRLGFGLDAEDEGDEPLHQADGLGLRDAVIVETAGYHIQELVAVALPVPDVFAVEVPADDLEEGHAAAHGDGGVAGEGFESLAVVLFVLLAPARTHGLLRRCGGQPLLCLRLRLRPPYRLLSARLREELRRGRPGRAAARRQALWGGPSR
jgi:hypothetical protein